MALDIELNLTASSPQELEMAVIELAKSMMGGRRADKSVDELIEELRSKLASQGMDVKVVGKLPTKAGAPVQFDPTARAAEAEVEEKPEAQDEPEVAQAKRKRGGQPKVSKDEAAEALTGETPTARKARCVAKLQDLFANGHKAEVLKILAEHGGGAKTFAAVDETKFEPISEALEAL